MFRILYSTDLSEPGAPDADRPRWSIASIRLRGAILIGLQTAVRGLRD
jgi:hypothetical protein